MCWMFTVTRTRVSPVMFVSSVPLSPEIGRNLFLAGMSYFRTRVAFIPEMDIKPANSRHYRLAQA